MGSPPQSPPTTNSGNTGSPSENTSHNTTASQQRRIVPYLPVLPVTNQIIQHGGGREPPQDSTCQ